MFKYFLIVPLITILWAFYYKELYSYIHTILHSNSASDEFLFSPSELEEFDGARKPYIYLAILGNVFDVTKGERHYGPGKEYSVFAGRDASKNFITGEFQKTDLTDDVTGLNQQQLRSLNHWYKFYKKDYKRIGKLVGRYYNIHGKRTPYGKEINKLIKDAERAKENEDLQKTKFPPCNVEWNPETGSRVWCTTKSGGIEREWPGLPRQLFEPGSNTYRCACIHESQLEIGNIKEYQGCDLKSTSCFVKESN